jgi:predicted DNA-binding transcriptional regulator YafY
MPATPAARLFALLEVLQSRPSASGAELAAALNVTERTLRRYVGRLVDLGIPIESERGPYGGYLLRPRHRLPPLMLTPDEAVAVTLGLMLSGRLGITAAVPAASGALAKLLRVLPDALRDRVAALQEGLAVVTPAGAKDLVDATVLAELGAAAGRRRRVTFTHRSTRGSETRREVDPYGVVFQGRRWYLVGHDHGRDDLRTFRLDRVADVQTTRGRFRLPDGFDVVGHLVHALATVPYGLDVEVVLHVDRERARTLVAPTVGQLEDHPQGVLLRVGAESAESAAHHLVAMGVEFTVVSPEEVRTALLGLADAVREAAQRRVADG